MGGYQCQGHVNLTELFPGYVTAWLILLTETEQILFGVYIRVFHCTDCGLDISILDDTLS